MWPWEDNTPEKRQAKIDYLKFSKQARKNTIVASFVTATLGLFIAVVLWFFWTAFPPTAEVAMMLFSEDHQKVTNIFIGFGCTAGMFYFITIFEAIRYFWDFYIRFPEARE